MKRTKLTHMVLMLSAILSAGCEKKASVEIDFGTITNSIYNNEYFGLTVPLPAEWSVQDQESQQRLMETGKNVLAGEDKLLKATIKASELKTVNLFAVFKHPIGFPVPFNPSMICLAERVRQYPGIQQGRDYLFHTKKFLESGQLDISFPTEISEATIGGLSFDVMYSEMSSQGMLIRQKYYATILNGYALAFITSFTSDEDETPILNTLESTVITQSTE